MVIRSPEEVNAAIVNGKQSKEYFHRVTGHAGYHLMDATAKYYKVDLTGKVNNHLSSSLEKIRQKNIPKKNEDKSKDPGERMYLDISSMRKPRIHVLHFPSCGLRFHCPQSTNLLLQQSSLLTPIHCHICRVQIVVNICIISF